MVQRHDLGPDEHKMAMTRIQNCFCPLMPGLNRGNLRIFDEARRQSSQAPGAQAR
jgi:hypothetical protein